MQIYRTTDYSIFSFLKENRSIGNIKKLKESIQECDMTPYCPIIVTQDFKIIDGQHRFYACKELGLPIYYVICNKEDEDRSMILYLNTTARNWRQEEFLDFYAKREIPEYIKLKSLLADCNIGISNAILLFSHNKTNSTDFKLGKLIDDSSLFVPVCNFLDSIDLPPAHKYYRAFVNAVMLFIDDNGAGSKAVKKLQQRVVGVPKFASVDDNLRAFTNITRKR